jgi:hypothetical protein
MPDYSEEVKTAFEMIEKQEKNYEDLEEIRKNGKIDEYVESIRKFCGCVSHDEDVHIHDWSYYEGGRGGQKGKHA